MLSKRLLWLVSFLFRGKWSRRRRLPSRCVCVGKRRRGANENEGITHSSERREANNGSWMRIPPEMKCDVSPPLISHIHLGMQIELPFLSLFQVLHPSRLWEKQIGKMSSETVFFFGGGSPAKVLLSTCSVRRSLPVVNYVSSLLPLSSSTRDQLWRRTLKQESGEKRGQSPLRKSISLPPILFPSDFEPHASYNHHPSFLSLSLFSQSWSSVTHAHPNFATSATLPTYLHPSSPSLHSGAANRHPSPPPPLILFMMERGRRKGGSCLAMSFKKYGRRGGAQNPFIPRTHTRELNVLVRTSSQSCQMVRELSKICSNGVFPTVVQEKANSHVYKKRPFVVWRDPVWQHCLATCMSLPRGPFPPRFISS